MGAKCEGDEISERDRGFPVNVCAYMMVIHFDVAVAQVEATRGARSVLELELALELVLDLRGIEMIMPRWMIQ